MNYVGYFVKHKVLFSVLACVAAVLMAGGIATSRYLDRINFDDGVPDVVTTTAAEGGTADSPQELTQSFEDSADIADLTLEGNVLSQLNDADSAIHANLSDSRIWHSEDVINVLLAGIDYGSSNYPYGRSDAMILVSVNKVTQTVNLVSLSRAAYVSIDGYNNTRLSHAHGYGGAQLMLRTIEQNYKIDIDNYISTGFDTFKKIIDILGGCSIKLTGEEAYALRSKIKANGLPYVGAGIYQLNGTLALEYVRLRKIDTDRDRTGRQRKLLTAVLNAVETMGFNKARLLLDQILPCVNTDMSKTDILSNGVAAFSRYINWPIKQYVIPHSPTSLTLAEGFEVLRLDWDKEISFIHDTLYENVANVVYLA